MCVEAERFRLRDNLAVLIFVPDTVNAVFGEDTFVIVRVKKRNFRCPSNQYVQASSLRPPRLSAATYRYAVQTISWPIGPLCFGSLDPTLLGYLPPNTATLSMVVAPSRVYLILARTEPSYILFGVFFL